MTGIPSRAPVGADGFQPNDWIDPSPQNRKHWTMAARGDPSRPGGQPAAPVPTATSSQCSTTASAFVTAAGRTPLRASRSSPDAYQSSPDCIISTAECPHSHRNEPDNNHTDAPPATQNGWLFLLSSGTPVIVFLIILSGISRIQPSRRVMRQFGKFDEIKCDTTPVSLSVGRDYSLPGPTGQTSWQSRPNKCS